MKIYFKHPDGLELSFEREPMSKERFEMICALIGIFLVGSGLLKLALIMSGR